MAKNYYGEGEVIEITAGGVAIASGAVVVIGARVAIVLGDIPALETGSGAVTGVWTLKKAAADAVAQGALLYWDADDFQLTTVAAGNFLAGYAWKAAPGGTTVAHVKINA